MNPNRARESFVLTPEDAALVQGALESLGVALADHDHTWSDGERTIFEQAIAIVRNEKWVNEDE
jgi:hypothetical protein